MTSYLLKFIDMDRFNRLLSFGCGLSVIILASCTEENDPLGAEVAADNAIYFAAHT